MTWSTKNSLLVKFQFGPADLEPRVGSVDSARLLPLRLAGREGGGEDAVLEADAEHLG